MIKIGYDPKYNYDERFTQAEPSDVKAHGIFFECENKSFRLKCPRCGCVVEGRGEDVVHHGVGSYGCSRYIDVTCPECGDHMDDCCIVCDKTENEDVVVETFKAVEEAKNDSADDVVREYGNMGSLEQARKNIVEASYSTMEQLDRREEMYVTTHYLHVGRGILSEELPYEMTKKLYEDLLDIPNCGGIVFGKISPYEVERYKLSMEIVRACVMRDKVIIFDPNQSFGLSEEEP